MDTQLKYGDTRFVEANYGIAKGWLEKARIYSPNQSPPFVKIGRRVLYKLTGPDSLEEWLAGRLQNPGKN